MGLHDWIDLALGLGSIAALVGGVLMGIRATRHDAAEQRLSSLEGRHAKVEGFLQAKLDYEP